jgi:hypothetical protein
MIFLRQRGSSRCCLKLARLASVTGVPHQLGVYNRLDPSCSVGRSGTLAHEARKAAPIRWQEQLAQVRKRFRGPSYCGCFARHRSLRGSSCSPRLVTIARAAPRHDHVALSATERLQQIAERRRLPSGESTRGA